MSERLQGQRIVILGLARQGTALVRYLVGRGAQVVVSDLRVAEQLTDALTQIGDLPVELVLGEHPADLLDGADLLCLSGGVPVEAPIVRQAVARGIPLSNDSQLFMQACPAMVIAITGSAGKTTTTALTGEMCRLSGRRTWVGGNIGRSMLPDLDEIEAQDLVVMELSSFQLEIMTRSARVGAVLNITPNHLDRHKTMQVYTAAKARLLRYQQDESIAVLGQGDPGSWGLRPLVRGRLRAFSLAERVADGAWLQEGVITLRDREGERPLCHSDDLKLPGRHNVLNALAAVTLADSAGVPADAIRQAARTFSGVAHRLELVGEYGGARWFDDSIATAPERMMAAMLAFKEPIVLLAGGRDKDLPWREAAELMVSRVHMVVLFGEAGDLIRRQIDQARTRISTPQLERVVQVDDLAEAVVQAARVVRPGDVVLLSPGGTSFDAYQDFAARGDHFRQLVEEL